MNTYVVHYGGKGGRPYALAESAGLLAVRTHSRNPIEMQLIGSASLSDQALSILQQFELVEEYFDAGVTVWQAQVEGDPAALRDDARAVLKREADVRFAGRVLMDPNSQLPVLYTENLFVKFRDDAGHTACRRLIKQYGLEIKVVLEYAQNAYFLAAPEDLASVIAQRGRVALRLCLPDRDAGVEVFVHQRELLEDG